MSVDTPALAVFWFRRDLRLFDNKGLFQALQSGHPVLPLFIFDDHILSDLPPGDHRLAFICQALTDMEDKLKQSGGGVLIKRGRPADIFKELLTRFKVAAVYCNADHEPYGRKRDHEIESWLKKSNIPFFSFLDHLVMGVDEVCKEDGSPYQVFTPYSRRWKTLMQQHHLKHYPSEKLLHPETLAIFAGMEPSIDQSLPVRSNLTAPPLVIDKEVIIAYDQWRDYPWHDGTTRLGVHLRFGTLGIRHLMRQVGGLSSVFMNELIWREFYAMIMWNYPEVVHASFKPAYDRIEWRNNEDEFEAWKDGKTGYPLVDAGMRQLKHTGFMHNRLRMVTASFLSKHLLIDWRWGEAWFAALLFDYELSSNNGGWQWSAGTGCDAAPYFRIFNPLTQAKRYDSKQQFVQMWLPEFSSGSYPLPMVDHRFARERCLKTYRRALQPE